MSAIQMELWEKITRLDTEQQKQVLDFVQRLAQSKGKADAAEDWENQPWTDDEIRDMLTPKPRTGAQIAAWVATHLPDGLAWGDLADDADAADYVHRLRRQNRTEWGHDE